MKPKVVDLLRTRNRDAHRTNEYEIPNLIIRRGQEFNISITFDRSYINSEDDIILKFVTGKMFQKIPYIHCVKCKMLFCVNNIMLVSSYKLHDDDSQLDLDYSLHAIKISRGCYFQI